MTRFFQLLLIALVVTFAAGCEDDDDMMINIPADYTFLREGQSSVDFSGQTTRIQMAQELAGSLKNFDLTADDFSNMFRNDNNPFSDAALNASDKSIRSKVAASRDLFFSNTAEQASIREDFDGWLSDQVSEVFPNQNTVAAQGTAGQIADGGSTRYINGNGLEYDQAFVKSLIGGLMYDQMVNNYLSPSVLDEGTNRADNDAGTVADGKPYTTMEHKWDEAYGYLFGNSADGAKPLGDLGSADAYLNKYLGRVEGDDDYAGIAATMEEAFRTGRAAIVAGDYAERDRQAAILKDNATKVLAVRAVYYLNQGRLALANSDFGGGFHDLSEGYGFIYSLRFVPGTSSTTVDGWIDTLTNDGNGGFWTITDATLSALATEIATAYGITVEEAGS